MNEQIDDPKLTAFALNELNDVGRNEVKKLIAENAQAKKFVEETRVFAAALEARLKAEAVSPLTDLQKDVIAETALAQGKVTEFPRRAVWWTIGTAAAACLIILLGSMALPVFSRVQERGSQSQAIAKQKSLEEKNEELESKEGSQLYAKVESPKNAMPITGEKLPETVTAPSEIKVQAQSGSLEESPVSGQTAPVVPSVPARDYKRQEFAERLEKLSGAKKLNGANTSGSATIKTGDIEIIGRVFRSINARERDASQPNLPVPDFNTEAYDHLSDNPFLRVDQNPLSTFSIDVDTGSYANVRRFLNSGELPPKDAVRIEELLNYFPYDYPQPTSDDPFSVNVEVAPAPWNPEHKIARIGLKGREVAQKDRPACNLVFLLDVSGSMNEPNKLPLVKESMKLLVPKLNERDRVAIVVYAGASGLVLPSTEVVKRNEILRAIDELRPGGSTNGAAGIHLAYDIAKANFIKGGVNRVILATDGDFNVGVTNQGALVRLVEEKAKSGVFLTVLGFGMGNLKDAVLEKLADKGNGTYGYIDTKKEAEKTFVEQIGGTLVTIAKDVKIQVEFNPARVGAFRLIGYENRILRHEDFNDDKKDAGEIGAGHTVTALYELAPAGKDTGLPGVDPLKYQKPSAPVAENAGSELMTVKLRYKQPDGDTSKLLQEPVADVAKDAMPSKDFQFAAAVAEFGMVLRESPHKGDATFDTALALAENGLGKDPHGYRHEFMDLVRKAKTLNENR